MSMLRSRLRDVLALVRQLLREDVLVYELSRDRATDPGPPLALAMISSADALPARLPYAAADCERYFSDGWRLAMLQADTVPVSFGWVRIAAQHNVREVHAHVVAPPDTAWIVHCETPQPYRGKGYYATLIAGIAAACGARRCYIYCVAANVASRKGIEKAGYQPLGTIRRRAGCLSGDGSFVQITSNVAL